MEGGCLGFCMKSVRKKGEWVLHLFDIQFDTPFTIWLGERLQLNLKQQIIQMTAFNIHARESVCKHILNQYICKST